MKKNKFFALLSLLVLGVTTSNVFGQTIQLYYGNHTAAKNIVREFEKNFPDTVTSLIFETPNYKVRVGRFKDINKANILLEEIKKTYPGAFLLEPNNL